MRSALAGYNDETQARVLRDAYAGVRAGANREVPTA
jgi:hypothetical protein